ncbi:SAM-dependent methyltransferase, partial [Rhizobiaceae sp. 2RAB30]
MNSDIVDLRSFYASALGRLAEQSIAAALSAIWDSSPGERLVGLGYTLPWLDRFGPDAERVFAFMPATQGAVMWPPAGPSATALVFDEELPLVDSSIDRMLLVHSLEHAESPRETLKEIW